MKRACFFSAKGSSFIGHGFGLQTYAGVAKPTYRAFQLFHELGDRRLGLNCSQENTTVEMIATKTKFGYACIIYNHEIIDEPIQEECVRLHLEGLGNIQSVIHLI